MDMKASRIVQNTIFFPTCRQGTINEDVLYGSMERQLEFLVDFVLKRKLTLLSFQHQFDHWLASKQFTFPFVTITFAHTLVFNKM